MNYKEKLKEALKDENTDYEVVRWIESNFPELTESEDEKVKKEIIEFINSFLASTLNAPKVYKYRSWIAWIRKQGKQKSTDNDKIADEIINYFQCQSRDEPCRKHIHDKWIAWLEKQDKETSWKPSKEEMDVLYGLAYITNQYDEYKEEVITRLYQDLKREFFNGSSYENMFPNTEDGVRRRSTIQVLEYAKGLDVFNQYGKADIDKNIAWLERQKDINALIQEASKKAYTEGMRVERKHWLEKQGEKPQCKTILEVWKDMRLEVYQQASGNRHEPNYSDDSTKMFSLTDIDEIFEKIAEKQGEQAPAYKVEPKFKVGDVMRTLQEAANGIVNGMPVIISIDKEYYHCTNELIAIKNQDDYEFPPINMKQKPADKVGPKFKVGDKLISTKNPHLTYEIIDIEDNELGELDYKVIIYTDGKDGVTHNISCKNVDAWGELVKEKPAWSEEDEEELGIAIKYLQLQGQYDSANWLKSLKERLGGK